MDATDANHALAELNSPVLIGSILACFLFGISVAQTLFYYVTYPSDPLRIKIYVLALLLLDIAHIVAISGGTYTYYVHDKLDNIMPKYLLTQGYIGYFAISAVQCAYVLRVWLLGRNTILTYILLFTSLLQLAAGLGMNISVGIDKKASSMYENKVEIFGGLQLASSGLCDILITNVIDRLLLFYINIGALTCVVSAITLVMWFASSDNYVFSATHVVLEKVYINSLLVSLNARQHIRLGLSQDVSCPGRRRIRSVLSDALTSLEDFELDTVTRIHPC